MDDYSIHNPLLQQGMYIAVREEFVIPSTTNRFPLVDILSFISVEIVFSLLSNVRLHMMEWIITHRLMLVYDYTDNPC